MILESLRRPSADRMHAGRFTAFTDALLLGVFVVLGSLPVVTALPALAAATHLFGQRETHDETVSWSQYWRRWAAAVRCYPLLAVGTLALLLTAGTVVALARGLAATPGVFPAVVAQLAMAVALLRLCGAWSPGLRWRELWREAIWMLQEDPVGDLLLASAVVATVVLAAWIPPITWLLPGLLAVAAAAIPRRPRQLAG